MTTPEGPYKFIFGGEEDDDLYFGPDFEVWGRDTDAVAARLNQQHAEIQRLRDEVAMYRLALANALGIPLGPGFLSQEASE